MTTLLPTINYALDLSDSLPPIPDETALIKLAQRQSILPIISRAFEKVGIKNETLQNLICLESFSYVNRDYTLEQIYNAFDSSGIPYIPLKGSVLQYLYMEPWMRASFDVDILVHERDLDKAIKAIQTKAEMVFDHRAYHDGVMQNAAITLELHFSLKETMDNIDRLLDRVLEYAVPEVGSRYAMTPEYLIFHNVAHMFYHFSHGGLGDSPYIDLYLLRTKTDYDEGKLRELIVKCKIDRFYDYCCKLIDVWFEDDQHDEITSRMERLCFEGGVFGSKENSMAAKKRKHSGLSYFYHRLFEDRKSLEQIYPILRDKPELLIFYQIKRWGKGLTTSRERVKRELELMKNTDRDAVQTYDSLMKDLGL